MKLISSLAILTLATAPAVAGPKHAKPNTDINTAYRDLGLIAANEKDAAHSGAKNMGKKFADDATACSVEAKSRLDGGEAADTIVKVTAFAGGPRELKLGEVEDTVCKILADKAKTWDATVNGAHEKAADAVAAPLKAAGIGGDKLAFLVSQKGESDFYGVGATLLKTPEALKKASVLFLLSGGGTGEKWTLARRQFDGDKLTGSSQQDYIDRPGAKAFQ